MLRDLLPDITVHYSILLAGGLSIRMGQDKAVLQINGESLLQRGCKLLEESGSAVNLVSGREGFPNSVADIIPHAGPPGGLYSCLEYLLKLEQLNNSPIIIVPVDMPFLNADLLQALLNNIKDQDACHFEGEIFPCAVRASEKLRQHLQKLFADSHELGGRRSMRGVLEFSNSKAIEKSLFAEDLFSNINTPEEYKNLLTD